MNKIKSNELIITDNFSERLIIKRDEDCYALIHKKKLPDTEAQCIILNQQEVKDLVYFIREV